MGFCYLEGKTYKNISIIPTTTHLDTLHLYKKREASVLLICKALFFLDLLFCNGLYACSICAFQIAEFHLPAVFHWILLGLIWTIIQMSLDSIFKIENNLKLSVFKFIILLFVTFIVAAALLGPIPFIWLLIYPLIKFTVVVINKRKKFNKKYKLITVATGVILVLTLSASYDT